MFSTVVALADKTLDQLARTPTRHRGHLPGDLSRHVRRRVVGSERDWRHAAESGVLSVRS
jgi:hypothetical protein